MSRLAAIHAVSGASAIATVLPSEKEMLLILRDCLDRSVMLDEGSAGQPCLTFWSTAIVETTRYDPFSASIGATWNVRDGNSIALSLAHTERAPNMREMFADGSNLATNSYEVGLLASAFVQNYLSDELFSDIDIMEKSRSINLAFRKAGDPLELEIGAFYQSVDNYIFAHLLDSEFGTGARHNFLLYTAADADFYGVDGQISYQLAPASHIKFFGDYVDTNVRDNGNNLPRIPPGRLGARYEHKAGPLSGDLEYFHTFGQDKVASYETQTVGYDMLNATLSYRFDLDQTKAVEFYVRCTNLLNELAFVHTSFVKDQSPLRGRNFVLGMRHQF